MTMSLLCNNHKLACLSTSQACAFDASSQQQYCDRTPVCRARATTCASISSSLNDCRIFYTQSSAQNLRFRDEILNLDKFQVSFHKVGRFDFVSMFQSWKEAEDEKPTTHQRDVAFFILTETSLADELKADYPNENLIYRKDYQKPFKKGVL